MDKLTDQERDTALITALRSTPSRREAQIVYALATCSLIAAEYKQTRLPLPTSIQSDFDYYSKMIMLWVAGHSEKGSFSTLAEIIAAWDRIKVAYLREG